MNKIYFVLITTMALNLFPFPAPGSPIIELVGVWEGTANSIYTAAGRDIGNIADEGVVVEQLAVSMEIDFQDGAVFRGIITSKLGEHLLVGAIRSGGKTGYVTIAGGETGSIDIRAALSVLTENQLEVCYTQGEENYIMGVACSILTRMPDR